MITKTCGKCGKEHTVEETTVIRCSCNATFKIKVKRYLTSTSEWVKAGLPERSDEEVNELLAICMGCEYFIPSNAEANNGTCALCGCACNQKGGVFNKLRRSTESCPEGKW